MVGPFYKSSGWDYEHQYLILFFELSYNEWTLGESILTWMESPIGGPAPFPHQHTTAMFCVNLFPHLSMRGNYFSKYLRVIHTYEKVSWHVFIRIKMSFLSLNCRNLWNWTAFWLFLQNKSMLDLCMVYWKDLEQNIKMKNCGS